MNAPMQRVTAMVVSALFAAVVAAWLAFGSVRPGVGWSAGIHRPVREVIRLADEAMVATGIAEAWRWVAWGGAALALAGGCVLVWLALSAFANAPGRAPAGEVARPDRHDP